MKIGIDGREILRDRRTGIGRFTETFLEGILNLKKDWNFVLFGNQFSDFSKFSCYSNLEICIKKENLRILWDQYFLKKVIEKEKIDLFFSPYYKLPVFSDVFKIIVIHDIIPLMFKEYSKRNFLLKFLHHLYIKNADLIVTPSLYSKKTLINAFNLNEKKIRVIYEWINPFFKKIEHKEANDVILKYNISGEFILYVGNLKPHKNVNNLIKAYLNLNESIKKKYKLVIVGGCGPKDLENVFFIEYLDDYELRAFYNKAVLFVFPSFMEGFGLPPLEAIACECPVLSSNTSCMPEILKDAVLYFNPYDYEEISKKIEKVLHNENLREELVERGKKLLRIYNKDKILKEWVSVFER